MQGRRKLFYGGRAEHKCRPTNKNFETTRWVKRPKTVPKNEILDQKITDSKPQYLGFIF